jgi:hypothetical protein
MVFAAIEFQPEPPFPTGKTLVTSEAKLIKDVETAPAVAFKNPDKVPRVRLFTVRELEITRSEVEAVPETVSAVVEAYGKVEAWVPVAV